MVDSRFTLPIFAMLPIAGFCSVAHANVFERKQNGNLVEISQSVWRADGSQVVDGRYGPKAEPVSNSAQSQNAVRQHIQVAATRFGVDRNLVDAVAWQESRYNPRAISTAGAVGVMQLMPDTARQLGVRNPHDVEQNVIGGTAYLRQQLERFGNNVPLALAAYNAGPGAVIKYGSIPPYRETQNYVRQIMQRLSATSAYRAGY
ncbi:LT_GEWL_like domain containing protein [Sphingomonadaceae bacterium]